ncbi:MAG TPA: hypothetical protein VMK12_14675, partial [Anaeromyxobacteraceae bacterium]|nr:hypothetical protein [Anaeromyxobacteraceae bacterium]
MHAYYVERHPREAWRPILFAGEDLAAKAVRNSVAPAKRSEAAEARAETRTLADGTLAHRFRSAPERHSGQRDDACDARVLAERLRVGFVKGRIYKDHGPFSERLAACAATGCCGATCDKRNSGSETCTVRQGCCRRPEHRSTPGDT